jgi:hypothetical protein
MIAATGGKVAAGSDSNRSREALFELSGIPGLTVSVAAATAMPPLMGALSYIDQVLLAAFEGAAPSVAAVRPHFPLAAVRFQLTIQDSSELFAQLRIFNWYQHFHPAFEIARHRIS